MIRKISIDDLDPLIELFDAYRVFYEKDSDKKNGKAFLSERIQNNESIIFSSFTDEGKMTGFVQMYPIFSSTRMKRLWLLNDLFVDPDFRGKGISVELMNRCKSFCIETNSCGMILETAKTNLIGNNLYPKAGFMRDEDHNYYSWDL